MPILPFQRLACVRCPTHESSQIVSRLPHDLGAQRGLLPLTSASSRRNEPDIAHIALRSRPAGWHSRLTAWRSITLVCVVVELGLAAGANGSNSGAFTNSTTNPGGTTGSGTNPAGMGNPNANQDSRSANDLNRPNDLTNQNRSHRRR
jgi:hypothetical protein